MHMKSFRWTWIALLAALLGGLLWLAIAPFGSMSYSSDFKDDSFFIGKLSPAERTTITDEGIEVSAEPAYFSLATARPFQKAVITMEFTSPPPLLEMGLRRDKLLWNFDLKPVFSQTLESLKESANVIYENDLMLWQKEKRYDSINNFLTKLPPLTQVLNYRYNLPNAYRLQGAARGEQKEFNLGLRGAYQFYTYSNGEPISLSFFLKDRQEATKVVATEINIFRGAELIFSQAVAAAQDKEERRIDITTKKLEAGVYRVELKTGDDTITTRLRTTQTKISFIGRLWLVNNEATNVDFYTDSRSVTAQTSNPASRQRIMIDDKVLKLDETYKQIVLDTGDSSRRLKKMQLRPDDLIIAGDGVWSFSPDSYFNPTLRMLSALDRSDAVTADYVIARYTSPEKISETSYRSRLEFDLNGAYREKGKYSVMISAPLSELSEKPLVISNISVEFSGPSVFELVQRLWD